jgi:hypothetical protein
MKVSRRPDVPIAKAHGDASHLLIAPPGSFRISDFALRTFIT